MLEKFDPRDGKRVEILREDGTLKQDIGSFPVMSDKQLLEAYKYMLKSRIADEWAVSLNRQGRMPTYAPNKGQEANSLGPVMAIRNDDWLVPAFREMAGMMYRGIPLEQLYLYWLGNEMGSSFNVEKYHTLPISVPLASQALHAVGLSYADKYRGRDRVALTFVGDGATSEGDFYEAINFAGVWRVATIFYIQNNQWAISTPTRIQTASQTLAEKAFAAGISGVQVDGNDIFATYAITKLAVEKARAEGGPTLIEGYTYRLGAHTTADDPSRYRDEAEVTKWFEKDPLTRLEKYVLKNNIITGGAIKQLREMIESDVKNAFEKADAYVKPTLEDTFQYMYKEMPDILKEQIDAIKNQGKEVLK